MDKLNSLATLRKNDIWPPSIARLYTEIQKRRADVNAKPIEDILFCMKNNTFIIQYTDNRQRVCKSWENFVNTLRLEEQKKEPQLLQKYLENPLVYSQNEQQSQQYLAQICQQIGNSKPITSANLDVNELKILANLTFHITPRITQSNCTEMQLTWYNKYQAPDQKMLDQIGLKSRPYQRHDASAYVSCLTNSDIITGYCIPGSCLRLATLEYQNIVFARVIIYDTPEQLYHSLIYRLKMRIMFHNKIPHNTVHEFSNSLYHMMKSYLDKYEIKPLDLPLAKLCAPIYIKPELQVYKEYDNITIYAPSIPYVDCRYSDICLQVKDNYFRVCSYQEAQFMQSNLMSIDNAAFVLPLTLQEQSEYKKAPALKLDEVTLQAEQNFESLIQEIPSLVQKNSRIPPDIKLDIDASQFIRFDNYNKIARLLKSGTLKTIQLALAPHTTYTSPQQQIMTTPALPHIL